MSLSGLEEGIQFENQVRCLSLYPESYLAEFPSASLVDKLVPQCPGYTQKIARPGRKKEKQKPNHNPKNSQNTSLPSLTSLEIRNQTSFPLYMLSAFGTPPNQEVMFVSPWAEKRLDIAVADSHC